MLHVLYERSDDMKSIANLLAFVLCDGLLMLALFASPLQAINPAYVRDRISDKQSLDEAGTDIQRNADAATVHGQDLQPNRSRPIVLENEEQQVKTISSTWNSNSNYSGVPAHHNLNFIWTVIICLTAAIACCFIIPPCLICCIK